ncbi:MAG: hypothetical protein U5K69_02370 [Balneolaceae bacterium]|nr:hypothetical protein [Balneolaceae bacterium]
MKVRLQQLNPTIGNLDNNVTAIIEAIRQADLDGIDLLVLPEMTVSGYPPMDTVGARCLRRGECMLQITKSFARQIPQP